MAAKKKEAQQPMTNEEVLRAISRSVECHMKRSNGDDYRPAPSHPIAPPSPFVAGHFNGDGVVPDAHIQRAAIIPVLEEIDASLTRIETGASDFRIANYSKHEEIMSILRGLQAEPDTFWGFFRIVIGAMLGFCLGTALMEIFGNIQGLFHAL
jgi:hypothetical protein